MSAVPAEDMVESVKDRVIRLISRQLDVDPETVKDEDRLTEDLGADSLVRVEIIMAVEDEFKIEISDEDAEKIRTVGEAIDYIKAKAAEAVESS